MAKLLVVDDEPSIRELLSRLLRIQGYEVDEVEGGEEALEACRAALAESKPYHVVIMDLNLPGEVSGKDVAISIQALDPNARLIISSGSGHDPIMTNYQKYGFNCALLKPFKTGQLVEAIERVLKTTV